MTQEAAQIHRSLEKEKGFFKLASACLLEIVVGSAFCCF